MTKIVVATTNKNKVKRIERMLDKEKYQVVSLEEYGGKDIPEPKETQDSPTGIAIEKALHYVKYLPEDTIVLTQDDTIVFENIKEEDDPGLHVKGPVIEKYGKFNDKLGAEYYKDLADKYGGVIPMKFVYGHAIAIKKTKTERPVTKVVGAQSEKKLRLVNKINKLEKCPGYFLSALTELNVDGKWISNNDVDTEIKVKTDIDLYNSITTLLKEI